jgi:hypothetical protein
LNKTGRYLFSVLILTFAVSSLIVSTPGSVVSQFVQAISTVYTSTTSTTTTQTAPASSTTSTSTSTSSTSTSTTTTSTSTSWSYTSSTTTSTTNSSTSTSYTATAVTSTTTTVTISSSVTGSTTTTVSVTSTTTVGPPCPVAMVAAGSVLEPLANGLRDFRNSQIMRTEAGYDFMVTFNSWYYSWAPGVAQLAGTNPWFADALRVGIVPLFGILYTADFTYNAASLLSPEVGAVTAGLVAASLIGLIYVAPLAYLSLRLLRLQRRLAKIRSVHVMPMAGWLGLSGAIMLAAYMTGSSMLMGLSTASLTLSALSLGCVAGTRALARIQPPTLNMVAHVIALKQLARRFPNL